MQRMNVAIAAAAAAAAAVCLCVRQAVVSTPDYACRATLNVPPFFNRMPVADAHFSEAEPAEADAQQRGTTP